jgi:hypothetical protein
VSEPSTEASLAAALAPFGWTCGPEFWQRYYSDPWVFNLANAVERLAASESARERAEGEAERLLAALVEVGNYECEPFHTGSRPDRCPTCRARCATRPLYR